MAQEPIRTPQQLAAAAVQAFLDGDPATRQHIVDQLGARAVPAQPPDDEEPLVLDWTP